MIRLSAGLDTALVAPEAGGRLASLVAGGRERLLDRAQPGSRLPSISWGSFLMAPWVGRIRDGRVDWRGRVADLASNDGRHAIHGAGFDQSWQVDQADDRSVELSLPVEPDRWPFGGRLRQRLNLSPGSLAFEATFTAGEPSPAGLGWHPWFRREPGEALEVTVLADRRLELDTGRIPSGRILAVERAYDLRRGPRLGGRRLDDVYVGASSPAIVRWPDLELRLEFGPPVTSIVVFSPPGSVCVEPATAWPDAIRLAGDGMIGTGLVELEAGQELRAEMTWHWTSLER